MLTKLSVMFAVLLAASAQAREPYLPPSDDTVLSVGPPASDPRVARLGRLRTELAKAPEDPASAAAFAREAIALGRSLGEPRYQGYAQAALEPWAGQPDAPLEIQVLIATLTQHRHEFGQALKMLDSVIEADPTQAQARLSRAVIHNVQGRPQQALQDCRALLLQASALVVASCAASASALSGDARRAYVALGAQLDSAPDADPEVRLWALTLRAEIAERLGLSDTENAYRSALSAHDPQQPDPYLLAAFADFLLAQGRAQEAYDLLLPHARLAVAELRLAIAEKRLGKQGREVVARVETLKQREEEGRLRGDAPELREQAMLRLHVLNQPIPALWLAQENWRSQREPLDALLLLDAAAASGKPEASDPVRVWLAETGLEDVRVESRLAKQAS